MLPVLTRPLPKRNENVTAACFRGTLLVSDAGGPSPLAARPSSGRVDVVASFDLLTATAVLDDESSFILILIVTVTGAVDSVDGEVVRRALTQTLDGERRGLRPSRPDFVSD